MTQLQINCIQFQIPVVLAEPGPPSSLGQLLALGSCGRYKGPGASSVSVLASQGKHFGADSLLSLKMPGNGNDQGGEASQTLGVNKHASLFFKRKPRFRYLGLEE